MISSKATDEIRETDGIGWITALKSMSIRALVEHGQLQLDVFDERNLVERTLEKIKARVGAGRLAGQDDIGVRVGKVVNQYKVAKHFALAIGDNSFTFARAHNSIAAEAALDGIYIIRTSVSAAQMNSAEYVRNYKSLANVERAFRSLKTVDLKVRPIHHRTADQVRAHIFLCMLTYYVEWHIREVWRELMFADTDSQAKAVLAELATIVRNTCRAPHTRPDAPTFEVLTTPNAKQQHALELIQHIRV
jgi:hypothetical protein